MSTTTPTLGLFKYNTRTDGKETFDINTCMNRNWDILDESVTNIVNNIETELQEQKDYVDSSIDTIQQKLDNLSFRPDYSQATNCFNGWIAPCDGWLRCETRIDTYGSNVYIGGVVVHRSYPIWLGDWSGWAVASMVPIGLGQTVTMDGNATAVFYPTRKDL